MDWKPIETLPEHGNYLVWLSKPKFGSHVFPIRCHNMRIIGTSFDFDMPKPTHWAHVPDAPQ